MKVIFGISAKLIFMVTFIVVAAIGFVTAIATDLFKEESVTRVQEMNKDLAERLATETFSHLEKSIDKSKLVFETLVRNKTLVNDPQSTELAENILKQNDEILDFGIYKWDGKKGAQKELHEISFLQKKETQAEFEISPEVFKTKPLAKMAGELTKNPNLPIYLFNSSSLYKKPVLTLFYPVTLVSEGLPKSDGAQWIVRMDLRQEPFIKAFGKKAQISAYWVTSSGDLLVHSNPKTSMENYNFSQTPIVQKAQESANSAVDNQQMEFSDDQGVNYLGAFKIIPVGNSIVVAQIETSQALAAINRVQYRATLVALIVIGLAFLLNFSFSESITSPLSKLYRATEKISRGEFNFTLKPESSDEIGALTVAFSKMAGGIQERDRLKSTFNKFHSKEIADKIMSGEVKLGGEKKVATIFFSDIRDFTALSEELSPDEVVKFLNDYMTLMVRVVRKHYGVVDKYVGDAIMALWGVPEASGSDVMNSVSAALEMREVLIDFNKKRLASGKPVIRIGMGIHTGEVLAGNIGSEERLEYTVIGDTVNQASRIESANKLLGSDILISDVSSNLVKSQFALGPAVSIQVKGRAEKITVHEVIGKKDAAGEVSSVLTPNEQTRIRDRDPNSFSGSLSDNDFHDHIVLAAVSPAAGFHQNTASGTYKTNIKPPEMPPQVMVHMPIHTPTPMPVRLVENRDQTEAMQGSTEVYTRTFSGQLPSAVEEVWYLVRDPVSKQVEGPFSIIKLKSIVQDPRFNIDAAYVFKEGDKQMVALFEMPGFSRRGPQKRVTGVPLGVPLPAVDLAMKTPADHWLVHGGNSTIYGPFNFVQIDQMVQAGDMSRTSYVWQPGMEYWIYLYQIPGFDRRNSA